MQIRYMSSKIKDIIEYFARHDISEPTRRKVWRKMLERRDDAEADAAYKALWEEAGTEGIGATDIDAAYARIGGSLGMAPAGRHGSRLWLTRVAAVLVPLLVIAGMAVFYHVGRQTGDADQAVLVQRHAAPGDSAVVTLPDGSTVVLRGGSVLLYPSAFNADGREVYLVGRATFNVRHDEESPLKVITPYFEITDLGTVFDVASYPDGEESSASVASGKISLRVSGKAYDMSPDDMLIYNVTTGNVLVGKRDELSQRWKRAQVNLDDVTFAEAVKVLQANYDVTFEVRNHKYDAIRVTVHFNKGETLETTMRVVSGLLPGLKYKITSGKVVVE